jgi:hypothetical protein
MIALICDFYVVTGLTPIAAQITDTTIRTIAYGGIVMLIFSITVLAPLLAIISKPSSE